jgi:DNA-binding transcriptional regulator YhcF (GntR family)
MQIKPESDKPIFIQISEGIEDAIISGAFEEESQIPSITEFAVTYKINPATALKGISILVDSGIVYKKRGLGMFVAGGAVLKLREKRKKQFYGNYIEIMIAEAKRLGIGKSEIQSMIESGYEQQ